MNTFPFQPSNTLIIDQAASCLRCGTKFYLVNGTHKSQPPQANDGRLACCLVKLPGKARSSMCERQKGASVNHVHVLEATRNCHACVCDFDKGASIKYVRYNFGIFDPLPPVVLVCTIWGNPPLCGRPNLA